MNEKDAKNHRSYLKLRSYADYCILLCLDIQYIYFRMKGINDSSEACVLVLRSIYVHV